MPLSVASACCKLRRTTNCINTNTRSAMLNRQISPTTRWSYRRNSGVSDKERPFVRQERLTLLAFIQRVDLGDGTCDALSQALLLARGKGQRAHDQTAFQPRVGLPGLLRRAELDRVCKADRHRSVRLIECTVGVRQGDRASPDPAAKETIEPAVERP